MGTTSASDTSAVFCKPAGQACGDYLHGKLSWEFTHEASVVLEVDEEHTGMKNLSVSLEGMLDQPLNINIKRSGLTNMLILEHCSTPEVKDRNGGGLTVW